MCFLLTVVLTLPWKPEMEGNLETPWPVSHLIDLSWKPVRGLATGHTGPLPSPMRTISSAAPFSSSSNFPHQAGWDLGQWKPPVTSSDQESVPWDKMLCVIWLLVLSQIHQCPGALTFEFSDNKPFLGLLAFPDLREEERKGTISIT